MFARGSARQAAARFAWGYRRGRVPVYMARRRRSEACGHQVALQALPIGDRQAPGERRLEVRPHLRSPICRTAARLAGLIQDGRLDWLAGEVDAPDQAKRMLFEQPIMDADAEPADIDVHTRRLVLADDLADPSADLHRIEISALLDLRYAVPASPRDGREVSPATRRIHAED